MPLSEGKSNKTVSKNIKELHSGETYKKTEEKYGKERANRQSIAIALNEAGKKKRKK